MRQRVNGLIVAAVVALLVLGATSVAGRQLSVVEQVRAKYGTPLGASHGAFLIEVACATGKGLLRKDWGTFVRLPDGTGVSQDILVEPDRSGRHIDILGDGENRAVPAWSLVVNEQTHEPLLVDPARFYQPTCGVTPPPPPPPPPGPDPRIAALESAVQALTAKVGDLEAALAAETARPHLDHDAVLAVVSEALSHVTVTGTTEPRGAGFLRHSHPFTGSLTVR